MRIGIDARLWRETGVGRYIRALVANLCTLGKAHDFVLFVGPNEYTTLQLPPNWHKILAPIRWHTLREQLEMPRLYNQAVIDLVHVPYFSVPIFTTTPLLITIHDLTISQFATGRATTLPHILYWFKRLGYEAVLRTSLSKAVRIITVSGTVRNQLISSFGINSQKINVTYESGELENDQKGDQKSFPQPYLLYVGNAHPHKNIERLIGAFSEVQKRQKNLTLVLIGKKDYFYKKLELLVRNQHVSYKILFLGEVSNSNLKEWFSHAEIFILPSLSEGFGIPGLEAMSMGCPVIASDLPVFHEIYGDAAGYFNQLDAHSIASAIHNVSRNHQIRDRLISNGLFQVKKYSWNKMAADTLKIYESCIGLRSG